MFKPCLDNSNIKRGFFRARERQSIVVKRRPIECPEGWRVSDNAPPTAGYRRQRSETSDRMRFLADNLEEDGNMELDGELVKRCGRVSLALASRPLMDDLLLKTFETNIKHLKIPVEVCYESRPGSRRPARSARWTVSGQMFDHSGRSTHLHESHTVMFSSRTLSQIILNARCTMAMVGRFSSVVRRVVISGARRMSCIFPAIPTSESIVLRLKGGSWVLKDPSTRSEVGQSDGRL